MLKRNSNFTLIELIVVIVVLGILAAIVIPNISSFAKQAREAQYTADLRNIQTGFDMESAQSDNLDSGLVFGDKFPVTHSLGDEGIETAALELKLVDVAKMVPDQLRKLPKYVVNVDSTDTNLDTFAEAFDKVDNEKLYVVVGVQVDAEGKSKAVLNYVGKTKGAKDAAGTTIADDTAYIVR